VAGLQGEAVKVRVTAPPVEGEANEAVVRLLSRSLEVPRSAVSIARGQTGRRKRVRIEGLEAAEVRRRLGV
jgi:uncharacterized protein (TIGR00251 family)